jgi:hypothetical protein
MADDYTDDFETNARELRALFEKGNYVAVLGWLQWVMRLRVISGFADQIDRVLKSTRAAYRVLDRDTIVPIASEAEKASLIGAFSELQAAPFGGARTHLRNAASELTQGRFSNSVRESIHAVESVARVVEPSAELSRALGTLERSAKIHGALKKGFLALYGYTSDEEGIRHPLLDGDASKVDENDALFMIGACASFISYMIGKARTAGLLNNSGGLKVSA